MAVNWAQVFFNSAITGSLYLIGAVGLTLTYGLSNFPNFAHAEFITLGAFIGYIVDGTRTVGFGTKYEQFVTSYTEKYGEAPEIYCDTTYDAVLAAATAIEVAGKYDGKAIRDALATLSIEGASGPLGFDEIGDRASGSFELWKVVKDPATETGYKNVQIKLVTLK